MNCLPMPLTLLASIPAALRQSDRNRKLALRLKAQLGPAMEVVAAGIASGCAADACAMARRTAFALV